MPVMTDEIRALRKTGVAASNAAKVAMGKLFEPYAEIVLGHQLDDNDALSYGRDGEPFALARYKRLTGAKFLGTGFMRSKENPLFIGNPDEIAERDGVKTIVEVKCIYSNKEAWGWEQTEDLPAHFKHQIQWYMGITGIERGDIVVFLSGEPKIYPISFNPGWFKDLTFHATRFWQQHVVPKIPPVDSSELCSDYLTRRFPRDQEKIIPAPAPAFDLIHRLESMTIHCSNLEDEIRQTKNELKAMMGDATIMTGPGFKLTHKLTAGRMSTDWDAVAREANIPRQLIDKHTNRGNPYPYFKVTHKKAS